MDQLPFTPDEYRAIYPVAKAMVESIFTAHRGNLLPAYIHPQLKEALLVAYLMGAGYQYRLDRSSTQAPARPDPQKGIPT